MQDIEVNDPPMVVNGKAITVIRVRPLNFVEFSELSKKTNALGLADKKWAMHNRRLRMFAQVDLFAIDGTVSKFDDMSISQIPVKYSSALVKAMGEDQGTPGEVLNKNDGISAPILYKLGTPIVMNNGSNEIAITELEFAASTFGDVEEVLAETVEIYQTIELIKTCAKPVGGDQNLQALPDWAISQITMADGFTINEKILPRFLE